MKAISALIALSFLLPALAELPPVKLLNGNVDIVQDPSRIGASRGIAYAEFLTYTIDNQFNLKHENVSVQASKIPRKFTIKEGAHTFFITYDVPFIDTITVLKADAVYGEIKNDYLNINAQLLEPTINGVHYSINDVIASCDGKNSYNNRNERTLVIFSCLKEGKLSIGKLAFSNSKIYEYIIEEIWKYVYGLNNKTVDLAKTVLYNVNISLLKGHLEGELSLTKDLPIKAQVTAMIRHIPDENSIHFDVEDVRFAGIPIKKIFLLIIKNLKLDHITVEDSTITIQF